LFTLSSNDAATAIAKVWATVREWKVHFENSDVPVEQIEKVAAAFRHLDDISSAALRKLLP
jgi:serine/threonine-protein kinase HipA